VAGATIRNFRIGPSLSNRIESGRPIRIRISKLCGCLFISVVSLSAHQNNKVAIVTSHSIHLAIHFLTRYSPFKGYSFGLMFLKISACRSNKCIYYLVENGQQTNFLMYNKKLQQNLRKPATSNTKDKLKKTTIVTKISWHRVTPVVKVPLDAVPAPPVIEIQRSHTLHFIERVQNHLLGARFGPKLIYSSLTSDFSL